MNRRFLLLLIIVLPVTLYSQVYRYTKEIRIEYNGKNAKDTVYMLLNAEVRIDVQITKNNITVMRPPFGSGEPINKEVYTIKKMSKGSTETKITTKEGYTVMIYHNDGTIGIYYKKDNIRIDYGFYNGSNKVFRYEFQ